MACQQCRQMLIDGRSILPGLLGLLDVKGLLCAIGHGCLSWSDARVCSPIARSAFAFLHSLVMPCQHLLHLQPHHHRQKAVLRCKAGSSHRWPGVQDGQPPATMYATLFDLGTCNDPMLISLSMPYASTLGTFEQQGTIWQRILSGMSRISMWGYSGTPALLACTRA